MKNKVLSIILCCLIVIGIMPVQALAAYSDDDVPYGYTGIYTAEDLNNVRNNLSGRYALMADIDLTEATAEGGSLDCGYGWLPIGDTSDKSFSGIFLGRNHTITGLRIAGRIADYSGLFGYVKGGSIKELNLKDINISAKNNVGGIAGYLQDGTVSDVNISGSIIGLGDNVGGITGTLKKGTITNADVYGSINVLGNCAGGISGYVYSGNFKSCSNFSKINAKKSSGGIIGAAAPRDSSCYVSQCFNKGDVTAEVYAGGIIGQLFHYAGSVSDCYNAGTITVTDSSAGGIIGAVNDGIGTVYNCINIGDSIGNNSGVIVGVGYSDIFSTYYLKGIAGTEQNDTNSRAISLSLEQMKHESSFYNFDFDNVWVIDLGSDIKRPQLRNARETEDSGIVIEPEKHDDVLPNGYKGIYTVQDLYAVRNDLESNYILMRDIDLTEVTASGGDYDYNGQGWLPIVLNWSYANNGSYYYGDIGFSGIFDGNGHTISGLRIEGRTVDNSGLFGYVYDGTIKNLTLKEINISAGSYTGGVVGKIIKKVFPSSEALINCSFNGKVKGNDYVGGLVGYYSASIDNWNNIFVYKDIYEDYCPVKECSSDGRVEGNNSVGGLVGDLSYAGFSECYNIADVYGLKNIGGICGKIYNNKEGFFYGKYYDYYGFSKNDNVYNVGDIYGETNVGGICGSSEANYNISYTNCYNAGEINYVNSYGAITGEVSGENNKFYNCYYLKDSADTACSSTKIFATVLTAEQMKQEDSFSGFDFYKIWIIDNDVDMKYPQLRNNMENPAEEISIKDLPEKLTYYHHEELDVSGLTITVKYKGLDGQSVKTVSTDMVSGYDPEKVGEQTLTVNYLGAKTTFNVTVKELPVEEVIISENEMTLDIGKTAKLSASVFPANATNTSVLWSSSEPDVVRVDGNGNIAALKKGSAVITATASNGVSASCTVTVYLPAESVSLDKSELNMDRGESEVLIATLKPITPSEEVSCGSESVKPSTDPAEPSEEIIWYSENTSVADVNNGVVTAKGAGKTKITVRTTRGKTASCDVNVYVSAKEVTIDPSVDTIEVIDSLQLTVKMSPSDTTDTLTWESSDESIATVSRDGVITPHKPGIVTISAKATHGAKAEKTIVITGHEHTYGDAVVYLEPTCTKTGISKRMCTKCKYIRTDTIPELGHVETAFPGIPATCTQTGLTGGVKCSVCGEILVERKEIPSLGHKSEIIEGTPATCTQPGLTNGVKCPVCEEIIIAQKRIPALGHAEAIIKGKPATCTELGLSNGIKCSVCGEILTAQKEVPALGHKEVKIEGKSATCTETGLTDGVKCSVCGEILTAQKEIPALGHKEVKISGKSATCMEKGLTDGTKCSVCGEILTAQEEIPALGHKEVKIEGKSATCTEKGLTDGVKCYVCGEILTAQKEIPALGHKEVKISGKSATCTEKGLTDGTKCSVCGEILTAQKEISALGHQFDKGVCTVCGAIDPDCKLILKSDSKLILLEEKALIVGTPENTNGITADEFKSQIDSDINLDMNENTAISNGMTLKFGTHEYTVIIKGDANADSKINASDARTILRIAARLEQPDEITKEAADIDSDGKVTSAEARSVLRFAAKLQKKIYE